MTKLLEKVFSQASKLPPPTQDLIAQRMLEEIEAELKWDETFAGTGDELSRLADEALADFKAGKTKSLEEVL